MLCVKSETCTSILWDHKNQSKWSLELCQFAVWQVWHTESYQSQQHRMTTFKKKKAHKQIAETTVIILARFLAEDKVSKLTKHERDGKTKSKMNKKKCNGWRARDVYATCCPCSLPSPHSPSPLHRTIRPDSDWIRIVHAIHSRFYANFDIIWGPLWDFLVYIVDADICLLFRLLLFTAHSSSMF